MAVNGVVLTVGVILGFTTLTGILGNFAVCLAICWNRSMRTPINMLLVNLAVADIGMSASCMPFAVATVLFHEQVPVNSPLSFPLPPRLRGTREKKRRARLLFYP